MENKHTIKCHFCDCEVESIPQEVLIARSEDYWINHCEAMFRNGGQAYFKYDMLPAIIQTERMKSYMEKYAKRVAARNAKSA